MEMKVGGRKMEDGMDGALEHACFNWFPTEAIALPLYIGYIPSYSIRLRTYLWV